MSKTFFELYEEGNALEEEIDDFVDAWHAEMAGKSGRDLIRLPTYLGMSQDEYDVWVQKPDALPYLLGARRDSKNIEDVMREHFDEMLLAARAADDSSMIALKAWLKARDARRV